MIEGPSEIHLRRAERVLEVSWPDGTRHLLSAEYLRVESPSAEVQGHGLGQRILVAGRRHIGILRLEAVGHYALRIIFDDLHDTGIYAWPLLRRLGEEQRQRWANYEAELAVAGLTRDPSERQRTGKILWSSRVMEFAPSSDVSPPKI